MNGNPVGLSFDWTFPPGTIVADSNVGYIKYSKINGGFMTNGNGGNVDLFFLPNNYTPVGRHYTGGDGNGNVGIIDIFGGQLDHGSGGEVHSSFNGYYGTREPDIFTGGNGTGIIETVNIYNGASVRNGVGGWVNDSPYGLDPFSHYNVLKGGNGTGIVGTANIYQGIVTNGGTITFPFPLHEEIPHITLGIGTGSVSTANVKEEGILNNSAGSSVEIANIQGGTVNNGGLISELNYYGGSYSDNYSGKSGTITKLTIAGDATDTDWGSVENLKFDDKGEGILRVTAFKNDPMETASFASVQAAKATVSDIKFDGMKVEDSIDFAYGNVVLTMSDDFEAIDNNLIGSFMDAFGFTDGFNLNDFLGEMFSVTEVNNADGLNSFKVAFDFPSGLESFWLIANGQSGAEWTFDAETGYVTWADLSSDGNGVPEPATLLVLGLGLAGLGLARRRR